MKCVDCRKVFTGAYGGLDGRKPLCPDCWNHAMDEKIHSESFAKKGQARAVNGDELVKL